MVVKRIFVEKRQGFFDIPAQRLCSDLIETFRLTDLRAVRIITRYDVEGLSDEDFARVRNIVFADPPVDTVYEDTLPSFSDAHIFAIEPLPGQFDPTAAAAAECVQLVTQGERPDVRTARVIILIGKIDEHVCDQIKAYLINTVESREASLAMPATLETRVAMPADVEVLAQFNQLSRSELALFHAERGFAMSDADLEFVQQYFRDTEHRAPTITELRVIDTYWSDHCRHTTFTTAIDAVNIESGFFGLPIVETYQRYIDDRRALYKDGRQRDMTLMDIAVIGMKALRAEGKLDDLDESEEINASSIRITVDVNGKDEDWLLMFKNETHNHPTEIEPFGGAATCLGCRRKKSRSAQRRGTVPTATRSALRRDRYARSIIRAMLPSAWRSAQSSAQLPRHRSYASGRCRAISSSSSADARGATASAAQRDRRNSIRRVL